MTTPKQSTLKSQYELIMEELAGQGNVNNYNDQESMEIMRDINAGLGDFIQEQIRLNSESESELSDIVLSS